MLFIAVVFIEPDRRHILHTLFRRCSTNLYVLCIETSENGHALLTSWQNNT